MIGVRKYVKMAVPISVDSEALVAEKSFGWLGLAEGVLFDCDGVLIDSRGSYGRAVVDTVEFICGKMGLDGHSGIVSQNEIEVLRSTGHFNNSVDIARTILLGLFLGLPEEGARTLAEAIRQAGAGSQRVSPNVLLDRVASVMGSSRLQTTPPSFKEILRGLVVEGQGYSAFRRGLEAALDAVAVERNIEQHYKVYRDLIGDTGQYGVGLVETVFDDIYYGPMVADFKRDGPYFNLGSGLYRNEARSIRPETLKRLSDLYGADRLAVITGRNKKLAQLVLGELYNSFNDKASVFIADEIMGGAPLTIQKPSPYSIIKSASDMGLPTLIYVGDSAEDALMAQNASAYGVNTIFVGVTGLSPNPSHTKYMFATLGADVITESVDALPFIVAEAKRQNPS